MSNKSILVEMIKDFSCNQMSELVETIGFEYNISVKYLPNDKWLIIDNYDSDIEPVVSTNSEIIDYGLETWDFNDLLNEIILIKGVE